MKHFMMPRNQILRENHEAAAASPNPKSRPTTPNPSSRKLKSSKENAPPTPAADPNSMASSPASKMRSPLPPRPPLKRKLSVESVGSDICGAAANSLDSGVKVIVRVRPPNKEEEDGANIDIFELVGAPLVENCLAGFNSSVFAYGQTGSGKTYTIWGASTALLEEEQQGLAPRVFRRLFERIAEEQTRQADRQLVYMCRCSFLEIYNEQITDLLDPSQKNLQIREDVKTGVYVENLREECVTSMKDVSQLLLKGLSNRKTSATCVNAESSRSHSVFTCVVESRGKSAADGLCRLKMSRINFVDLAGSERQKQTGAAGERLKEAGNINRSLSQLGNLINILAEVSQTGKQRHIPYRDSKLTFLLQESLGGNAKLAMICAISPSQSCKSETLSTLRFAQRAKAIKNKAIINEEMQEDVNVLREVIRQLRDELHRMKANNHDQTGQNGAYATGWSARRSLNLLRFSLNRPMMLPNTEDDSDEEMEIVDTDEAMVEVPEEKCPLSPKQGFEDTDVNMEDEADETVEMDKSNIIGDGLMGRRVEMSHESKSMIVLGTDGCEQSEDKECTPSNLSKKPVEQCSAIQLSAGTENTSEKSTNCIEDGQASDLSIVPIDVPPVLKSPAPSVSPKLNNSRKSLRTSSTVTASQSFPTQIGLKDVKASMTKPSKSICLNSLSTRRSCFASTDQLAATLHRGLEVIESQRFSPALRRSSFRFSCMPNDVKAVIPAVKVDVGVQTVFHDDGLIDNDTIEPLCSKCKTTTGQQGLLNDDAQNLQLVPANGSVSHDMCNKLVPKAVEKVLAGAIRREMALEEMCAKQNSEIMQLNRLVQQYKHERECNAIIGQTREDKIARLESLMDGILPTEEFMEEELLSLTHEHKILQEQYDNHPDVLRTKIELKRVQDELERYQNFFDLGERDVLLEEIQDLRTQLQSYLDSSGKTSKRQTPLLKLITSPEPGPEPTPTLSTNSESIDNAKERLEQERIQWTAAETKWISLVEELKTELEANRSAVQRQKQELDIEKKCSEELKEAMQMAMEGHARMLEQYAELEEKHMHLLARHRRIQDGIDDVKKAAAKAGVRGAESKFINALAAEISALKVEREKERRYFRDENKGLQAQLRDTAEAVQAAGELLVRLKEAEENAAAAERRAVMAEQETENAYKEIEKLNSLLAAPHLPKEEFTANDGSRQVGSIDQQWREEFAASYGVAEEPSSWFSGYDRCNI
ncbi:phragmoplast-associated kinesin-related protein [Striga asiatica]|uniref:Phragmoplast-associated kinesin-related protein n=1 Tax=Striga asiatica TaxID=4170 RepID=A0A5A7PIQ0_STRAF|nr:phragmoplast-associated kinesin-related protein [Striga asiatica]